MVEKEMKEKTTSAKGIPLNIEQQAAENDEVMSLMEVDMEQEQFKMDLQVSILKIFQVLF